MPVASTDQYKAIIDTAKSRGFALPAINVTSSQTINATLQGLAEAESDGIIQVSTGGADYFSGHSVKQRVSGALAFAHYVHEVAKNYPIHVAVHTDHCPKDALDGFVRPLLDEAEAAHTSGRAPLFQSHMWDGSAVPLAENLQIAQELLERTNGLGQILEVEIGVVGGEEDGVSHEINDKLYTTLDDAIATVEALGLGDKGRYMTALTFGNVHGVYKPGNVKLKPELLAEIQAGLAKKYGTGDKPMDLVFHGGSGSSEEEIAEAVANGVIKMNIDTDTQYAFTRSVAHSMFTQYDQVLKVDGEVGNKKVYDPRAWGKDAESAMAQRVVDAANQLGSAGHAVK